MEQIVMENETPYLPPEIITNILVRLPVRSLIQFQCVCTDWKNLLKTPYFIEEHLRHSTQQNPLLVVDLFISECNPWDLCLLTRDMQVLEFKNPPFIDSLNATWRFFHSSNGLLCVELFINESYSCWLWNPAIREVRQVPDSLNNNYKNEDCYVGFGFSPIVNDYKIVKLLMIDDLALEVEVYSLRTGLWRKVELGNLEGVTIFNYNCFTCNGSIFWVGLKLESDDLNLIVSFDIATEVFTLMPFPTSVPMSSSNMLTMYDNKLALLCSTYIESNNESSFIDLWVMEECTDPSSNKERWSWTKIYTSKPYPCWLGPMIIWRNEIVCKCYGKCKRNFEGGGENDEAKAVLCNITTNEFNMFAIPQYSYIHKSFYYVESLVPVSNIHVEEP